MPKPNRSPIDEGRPETNVEYHRRIQDQMDEDSWAGRSTVSASFPEPAIVHEMEPSQDVPHVYKWGKDKRYGDGH